LSLLSAINAGNTGTNRPHQAEISTAGRLTSAGRVTCDGLYLNSRVFLGGRPGEIVNDFPGGEWRRVERSEGYRAIVVNGEMTS
jgi:hypothetical protein